MKKYLVGFDPGGERKFGWCVIQDGRKLPLRVIDAGVEDHAEGAVEAADRVVQEKRGAVIGVGIDAPLFWVADGDRAVDQLIRQRIVKLGAASGTVQAVNSLRGACLVQGMLAGMLSRKQTRRVHITESHPKAVLRLWHYSARVTLRGLIARFFALPEGWRRSDKGHNLRDAALAALTAWAMVHRSAGWRDIAADEQQESFSLIAPPPSYWVPG